MSSGFFSISSIIAFCSSLGNSVIIARILLYTSFPVFFCWGSLLGHWSLRCPVFLHLKQAPFLISSACLLVVMESTSMAFRSRSFFTGNWNLRFVWLIDGADLFFLPKMCCIFCQLEWNFVAFSYHSFKVVGGFLQVITCFWSGVGSVSLKKSMTAVESNRPDQVTNILNLVTCSSILLLLAIHKCFISSRASPGPSNGSNDFLIVSLTSLKVPNFKSASFFLASLIFRAKNSSFHEAASPSVIKDRRYVIFFSSLL